MARTATAKAFTPPQSESSASSPDFASLQASSATQGEASLAHLAELCLGRAGAESVAAEDWPALMHMALAHGVAPLLYLRVGEQRIPEPARAELARLFRANLARNMALDRESENVLRELRAGGISGVPLKGPRLAQLLYGEIGARQVADLDLLVRPADLPAADTTLERLGFARASSESLARLQSCRDVLYSAFRVGGSRLFLDLHLRLRPYGGGDVLAGRVMCEGMTRENLLLYLCLNLLTHRWARLQPWLDLAAFLRKEGAGLNWKQFEKNAKELEWAPGVFFCLRSAAQLADMRVPDAVLRALRPSRADRWWVESILGHNAGAAWTRADQLDGPRGTLAILGCERGLTRKLKLAAAILFPPAPTLRQMDAPGANLSLGAHYFQRIARKVRQLT